MNQLENALRNFDAGDGTPGDVQAAALSDPSALASKVLAVFTAYENSDWDETELRQHLAPLVPRGGTD
jgi:hypothetical protein